MEPFRRCLFLAALAATAFAAPAAHGQSFPSRPIEFVVHTSPGGGTDLFARIVAEIIAREKLLGQPINVVNRTGGGGAIAYTYIKSKRGEPHTVMTVATLAMLTQVLRPEMDLGLENYTPLAFLAQDPQAVMVAADSPHRTFRDLVDAARREPNTLVASVTSPGGSGRLLVWLIERATGTRYRTVSFKSGADAIIQVMGGHTQFTTENISEGYAAVESKKLRVLAVTSAQRLAIVPDTPTLRELGHDIHVGTGRGFVMPAGVPKDAAARMEAVLERVHKTPQWQEHAERNLYENIWMGSAEYGRHLAARRAQHQEFMQAVGLAQKP